MINSLFYPSNIFVSIIFVSTYEFLSSFIKFILIFIITLTPKIILIFIYIYVVSFYLMIIELSFVNVLIMILIVRVLVTLLLGLWKGLISGFIMVGKCYDFKML